MTFENHFPRICMWMWIDEADIPDDGTKHRHVCGLPSGHDGDHECRDDQVARSG
jgi:hypothetical protein